ncbi:MAG: response regulator, partial [Desulfobacula sp.]|nr:response regulator [Desulfobacula sp.]
ILSKETNDTLLNKIIRTAGKMKLEDLIDDVAEFIFYDHISLKTDAIKALERIGGPRCLERLEQVAVTDKCDQDVLDAIDVLKTNLSDTPPAEPESIGQQEKTDTFEANLSRLASDKIRERYQAFTYFSGQGYQVAGALADIIPFPGDPDQDLDQGHDLLINLLRLTAITIPRAAITSLFTLLGNKKIDNKVRFAVYNALEAFPELESAAGILKGISEPSMYVRMAAVKVLERHCSDYIVAEIKNKIESGTKTGEILVHTILDARAIRLIEALMISDTFSYIASNYLDKSAPIQVIESFIKVLEKRDLKSTVKKFTHLRDQKSGIKKAVFVVISSSRPFLDVYAQLIDKCGYGTRTFTDSQKAFEAIVFEKPAAIVCDLFLNHMTGLDLAREVREMYSQQELPIIISSLEKEFSRAELDAEMKSAKVDLFCEFPAKLSQIKSWITSP